jgi:ribonuclease D
MSDLPYDYIADDAALAALCKRLEHAPYLVLDTEFLRERTYRAELCLIQIKYQDTLAIVDAQTITDLSPLVERLLDTSTVKVLHAASQDLEIFWMMARRVPTPVFDTQLAAPLLGHAEQIGYANLCKAVLDLEIDKSQTRADWTRRPLPEKQIEYALDDVIHLETLYLEMTQQLKSLGRLDWLEPEFRAIEAVEKYDQPAGERWKKVRQVARYKGAALACIQALAEWREIKARETNQPRNWLMKDEVLTSLAQQQPTDLDELGHIRGLDRRTRERFGGEIVALISEAQQREPEPLPPFRKKLKTTPATQARIQLLDAWVHQRASELDIAPGLLAPPGLLEKFVAGDGRDALPGWRDALIGEALSKLAAGEASLRATRAGLALSEN